MIFLTQAPLILFVGAKFDLIFGFNRMDLGFTVLLFLFVLAPFLNMSWFITEIIRSIKAFRRQNRSQIFIMPLIAILFLIESIVIDLYIASHARM